MFLVGRRAPRRRIRSCWTDIEYNSRNWRSITMSRSRSSLVAACALLYGVYASHPAPLHAQQPAVGSPTETDADTIEAYRYGLLQRLVVANKMLFGNRDYEDLTVLYAYRTSMFDSESALPDLDPDITIRILRPSGREGFLTATPYEIISPEDYCSGCQSVSDILDIIQDKQMRSDMFLAFEQEVPQLDYSGLFIVGDSR